MSLAPTTSLPGEVDVIVCGGGPAGSTAATVLGRRGYSVVLFERETFPRFHIGESLLPWNVPLLERIGALEKIRSSGVQVKYGARFYHQGTDKTRFVNFANGLDARHSSSFQVKRAEFDRLLLDHSRESGATIVEGARVEDVRFDEKKRRAMGVRVTLPDESIPREIRAKVVVDATGRDTLMARALGGRQRDLRLDRSSAFAHYDTFQRAEGPAGGDIIVITTPDGWWWLIPFSDGSVSVGIVMPSRRFKARKGTVEELFEESVAATPEVRALLAGARKTTEIRAIPDFSYTTPRTSGDGFCLVGDAACFLDPVFSSGVLMAMTSAELAAEAIDRALRSRGRVDASDFRRFERVSRKGAARFSSFVHGFYEPHFLEAFYSDAPNKGIEKAVSTILAGGVYEESWEITWWNFCFRICIAALWVGQKIRGKGDFERAAGIVIPEKPGRAN